LIANESRVVEINDHCGKLEEEEHPDIEEIKTKCQVDKDLILIINN